ncbi:TetR/AcrR family transcriptional regulator [Sphingobium sp.]|uniref:TetR/AcrR family transcriptional regulator n=1 Tax=Sphingobium sp. TaxID=1912891 RepID=UPI002C9DC33F|nr:TetR/AcrR family transcriptional regulator [Sphingobium sp.]HUD93477.1 TetR/AcrR family transcriptional regulator [Sphingobium sp.]
MTATSSTADDILATARDLVILGGYNGFSYADIAQVVGIRKPSVHHHFPTKAELMRTLVSRYRGEAKAGMEHLDQQFPDPLDRLKAYTGYWKACIENANMPFCVCALLACEIPVLPVEVAEEVKAFFRFLSGWLTTIFELGQKEGTLKLSVLPHLEAEGFMATIHGAMLSARAYGQPEMFGMVTDPLIARLSSRN